MYPHGLSSASLSGLPRPYASTFYYYLFLGVDMGNNSSSNLAKRLRSIPYQRRTPSVLHPWCGALQPMPQTGSGSPSGALLVDFTPTIKSV